MRWGLLPLAFLVYAIALVRPAALSEEPMAMIPLVAVESVHVRDHHGVWRSWIAGAPNIVNGGFLEMYGAPDAVPTPPPEPQSTGAFTLTGRGTVEGDRYHGAGSVRRGERDIFQPVTASGFMACTAEVTGNRDKVVTTRYDQETTRYEPAYFAAFIQGKPVADGYRHDAPHSASRRNLVSVTATDFTAGPLVVYFGDDGVSYNSFLPPYTLTVHAASEAEWTVRCEPTEQVGFEFAGIGRTDPLRVDVATETEMECEFTHRFDAIIEGRIRFLNSKGWPSGSLASWELRYSRAGGSHPVGLWFGGTQIEVGDEIAVTVDLTLNGPTRFDARGLSGPWLVNCQPN